LYCMYVPDCLSCFCIVCMYLIVCPVVVLYVCTWLFVLLLYCMYVPDLQQQDKQSGTYIQYNRTNNQVHTYNTTTGQTIKDLHTIQQQDKQSDTYIQYNNKTNNQIHTYNFVLLYCMYVPDCLSCCIVCMYLIVCPVVVLYVCTWLFVLLLYCMYVPDGLSCCCIVCITIRYIHTIQQQDKQSGTYIQYNNRTNNQVHTYNTTTRQTIGILFLFLSCFLFVYLSCNCGILSTNNGGKINFSVI
jgi:hypothetical protein